MRLLKYFDEDLLMKYSECIYKINNQEEFWRFVNILFYLFQKFNIELVKEGNSLLSLFKFYWAQNFKKIK